MPPCTVAIVPVKSGGHHRPCLSESGTPTCPPSPCPLLGALLQPLYLFDKKFVAAAPQLAGDFDVPDVFSEDLFSVLGDSRPDYR
jgi:hypothetical protein